jgi:ADP-ribosylglycohydrolase/DNA integrity scanning protein DisA with diadenylate cyclase activity
MTIRKDQFADKVLGYILGGAVGDATGLPSEFVPRVIVRNSILFGTGQASVPSVKHPLHKLPPGSYTDDTILNLSFIRYFTRHLPTENPPDKKIRGALKDWYHEAQLQKRKLLKSSLSLTSDEVTYYANRFAGTTTTGAAAAYHESIERESGAAPSNSCGPLVRIAPLLFARGWNDVKFTIAKAYTIQSHTGYRAIVATHIVARLIEFFFHRKAFHFDGLDGHIVASLRAQRAGEYKAWTKSEITALEKDQTEDKTEQNAIEEAVSNFSTRYDRLKSALENGHFEDALSLGSTSDAFDVLLTAIAIMFITKGRFTDTINLVQSIGGDADSIGFLAGAFSGLLSGGGRIVKHADGILDNTMQYSVKEIKRFVRDFSDSCVKSNPSILEDALSSKTVSLEREAELFRRCLLSDPKHFLNHGRIVRESWNSLPALVNHINDSYNDLIISDSGIIYISEKTIRDHPLCITSFLTTKMHEVSHPLGYSNHLEKIVNVVKKVAAQLRKVKDRDINEYWRLSNLLEMSDEYKAVEALPYYDFLGRSKIETMKENILFDKLIDLIAAIRDPRNVAERTYLDSSFIITHEAISTFTKRRRIAFGEDRVLQQIKSYNELLLSCKHHGGLYLVSPSTTKGPFRVKDQLLFDRKYGSYGQFPIPARDVCIAKVCQDTKSRGIFVHPKRNIVVVVQGERTLCFTRIRNTPESLRTTKLERYGSDCAAIWDQIIAGAPVSQKSLYIGVSLVMDMLIEQDHGCSVCIMNSPQRYFKGDRSNDQWLKRPIALSQIRSHADLKNLRTYFLVDGSVIIDAQNEEIVAYSQKFSPVDGSDWDNIPELTQLWLDKENRGMRHRFAAMCASQHKGRAVLIVGSERGDITVFTKSQHYELMTR